jgi:DNA mismatch endonuclease, patch repair protein
LVRHQGADKAFKMLLKEPLQWIIKEVEACQRVMMRNRPVKRHDTLTPKERSARMSKVRGKGNRSTELRVAAMLIRSGVRGWKRHSPDVPGCPDFYFVSERVAVFVDGCFWHGCPVCKRNVPHARRRFWLNKIQSNKHRDRKVMGRLRKEQCVVIRIWEHAVAERTWLVRLQRILRAADA